MKVKLSKRGVDGLTSQGRVRISKRPGPNKQIGIVIKPTPTPRVPQPYDSLTPFWSRMLERTGARAILDIGCGRGLNLRSIREALGRLDDELEATGVDVDRSQLFEAVEHGLSVEVGGLADLVALFPERPMADLVIVSPGALTHVAPAAMRATVGVVCSLTFRYLLLLESAGDREWFGHVVPQLAQKVSSLKVVETGAAEGFPGDYWLLGKNLSRVKESDHEPVRSTQSPLPRVEPRALRQGASGHTPSDPDVDQVARPERTRPSHVGARQHR